MEARLKNYLSTKLDRLQKLTALMEGKAVRTRIIKVEKEADKWLLATIEFAVEGGFNYCESGIIFKNSIESPQWLLRRWISNLEKEVNGGISTPTVKQPEDLPM